MSCHPEHPRRIPGEKQGPPPVLKTAVIVAFAAGGIYYLWFQHRAHVLQYLPLAFFLLCPLMHLFGGHGGHGGGHSHGDSEKGGRQ